MKERISMKEFFWAIAQRIADVGGRLYLVGGAVRDKFLGVEPKDFDYCVTGVTEEEFVSLFPEAEKSGKTFPVFRIMGVEFAFPRTEKGKVGTIEQDLYRRDLTINSMAVDVLSGELFDPFGGREDIQRRVIRATSSHFKSDPSRVYRVARFAAKYGFSIESETLKYMRELKPALPRLFPEQVFEELRKALNTQKSSVFFKVMRDTQVLDVHFKEIQALDHNFDHDMDVVDSLVGQRFETDWEATVFAGLVLYLDKSQIKELGKRISLPAKWVKAGVEAAKSLLQAQKFNELSNIDKVAFLEAVSKSAIGAKGIEAVYRASGIDIHFAHLATAMLDAVNGKTVKLPKGKEAAKILRQKREEWLAKAV